MLELNWRSAGEEGSDTGRCLGLAYKLDVDDFRESPSLEIVHRLQDAGVGQILACDPYASPRTGPDITLTSLPELLARSNIVLLLTDHASFRDLAAADPTGRQVVDTRGVWSGETNAFVLNTSFHARSSVNGNAAASVVKVQPAREVVYIPFQTSKWANDLDV